MLNGTLQVLSLSTVFAVLQPRNSVLNTRTSYNRNEQTFSCFFHNEQTKHSAALDVGI